MSARTEHQRSRGPAGGRLSLASLERLPAEIARPAYDAAHLGCGIVHLGIGAFHRAHQAFYTDAALAAAGGAWGIVGASLRGAGVRDRLAAQDCLYTVVEKSGAGARCRVIGAVRQVVFAREDRARLPVLIADRRTRIVSLTITEKGYCQDPATGRLDAAHPDIAHDIAQLDAPISAVGVLVCGLKQRFRKRRSRCSAATTFRTMVGPCAASFSSSRRASSRMRRARVTVHHADNQREETMKRRDDIEPRSSFAAVAAAILGGLFAGSPAFSQMPKSPVVINIVDVGGALALLQDAIEAYKTKNPRWVSRFTFTKAPAPELPAKIKAMQAARRADLDLVLGGLDILSAGIEQGLWTKMIPDHADRFPGLLDNYLPAARKMQELARDQAIAVVFMPSGPLIEYNPDKVKTPPTTPQALLAWCKAHPNRLIYARPANSGPGRALIMGLPYILGDKDPKDPVNGWDKTWAYLKELNGCIEYYPTGTGITMKEFGEGSRDITATATGWDINPRALGIVPKQYKVAAFDNMTWVNDTQYLMVPKGLQPEKLAVTLDLMAFLLEPEQQALTYDKGYFYPGPAVKDVPLTMAPKESQDVIKEFGRPEYDEWIAKFPHAQPLDAKQMIDAFRKWDQEVGAQKTK